MSKKVLFLFLLVSSLVLFVACGGSETPVTPQASVAAGTTEIAGDQADAAENVVDIADAGEPTSIQYIPFERRNARDMGGITLIANAWWLNWDWDVVREPDEPGIRSLYTIYRDAERRWNVNIEWTVAGWGENMELLATSVLAGAPFADMVRLENFQAMPSAVARGLLTPFEHIPEYINFDEIDPGILAFSRFGNYHYGYVYGYQSGDGVFFNRDIIEREGLTCPFELFENDQWNWDSFRYMSNRATRIAADGTIEQYGIAAHPGTLAFFLMLSNGGQMVDEVAELFVGDSINTIEAFEFLQQLTVHDNVVNWYDVERYVYLDGRALFIPMGPWFSSNIRDEMGPNFGFIPFPVGPRGSGHHSISTGPNMWFVPRGANPLMLTIYHESRRESGLYYNPDPDAWAEWFSFDQRSFDIVATMRHSTLTDRFRGFGIDDLLPWDELATGEVQPTSLMESIRAAAQDMVDDIFLNF